MKNEILCTIIIINYYTEFHKCSQTVVTIVSSLNVKQWPYYVYS